LPTESSSPCTLSYTTIGSSKGTGLESRNHLLVFTDFKVLWALGLKLFVHSIRFRNDSSTGFEVD
jgi:hypothetical protein